MRSTSVALFLWIWLSTQSLVRAQANEKLSRFYPMLAWPEDKPWASTNANLRLWRYVHQEWTRAEVVECSDNGIPYKVDHIYYWPGEHVILSCRVCKRGLDTNGRVKFWGRALAVDEFFAHFLKNKRLDFADIGRVFQKLTAEINYKDLQPDDVAYEPSRAPGSSSYANYLKQLPDQYPKQQYLQRGSKLHIHQIEARGGGVYFCFDDSAMNLVRHFYVLHAMTPISRVNWVSVSSSKKATGSVELNPDMGSMVCKSPYDNTYKCDKDCGKPIYIYPDTQWRFNWRPALYKPADEPLCDQDDTRCEDLLKKHDDPNRVALRQVPEQPLHLHVFAKRTVTDTQFYTNVALAFKWEPWSECKPGRRYQRREGHCVLQLAEGKTKTDPANAHNDVTKWMSKLDTIFPLAANRTGSIRLHSSILHGMIMGKSVTTDCGSEDRSKGVKPLNDFYEQVIFPSLDIPGEQFSRTRFSLTSEWRACFKYTHSGKGKGSDGSYADIIGTYVIQTKKCI